MSDISNQLIKDSYNYVLQSDVSTGNIYRIGGGIPVNPIFLSGLTINGELIASSISATTITTPFSGGSVLFAGTSGQISQNNSQLFWDNTNNRLGIGTNAPTGKLYIKQSADNSTDGIMMMGFNNTSTVRAYVNFGGLFTINRGGADVMGINTTGNVLIGTTTDSGYRLDVNGGTSRFSGNVTLSSQLNLPGNNFSGTYKILVNSQPSSGDLVSGTRNCIQDQVNFFNPNSGSSTVYNSFVASPTINQTNGSSGTTRGLYINPTITSAFDFRAIETVTGNVILGSTSGNTLIGTTVDSGFKLNVSGNTRIVNQLQVGVFNVGVAGASSSIVTQGRISAGGGVTLYNPSSGDNQDTGIFNSSGLLIRHANSSVATFATVGGASNGTNVAINQGYNPNGSGTGSVIGFSHDYSLYPITSNTISYTSYYARPSWQGPTFYDRITGPIRGFLFSNNLYNTQKLIDVIAFQSDGGRVLHQGELPAPISGTSRGLHINQTHTAIANNNVLVGLDVQPTFNNGAFTGVENIGLRITTDGAGGGVLGGLLVRTSGGTTLFSVDRQFGIVTIGNQLRVGQLNNTSGGNQIHFVGDGRVNINANGSGLGISFHNSQFGAELLRMFTNTGNLLIQNGGTYTDAGFRLDVNGTARVSTSIQSGGFFTNAANGIGMNSPATAIRISTNDNGANIIGNNTPFFTFANNGTVINRTTGTGKWFEVASFVSFAPTTGNCTMDWVSVAPTINQTGGASGTTRGLYVNPTLTAAADFRAIETTVGNVLLNTSSGNTLIGTTTDSGFKLNVSGNTRITGGLTATTISATTYQGVNRSFGVSFDGMGSVITVNSQSTLTIPYNMVIQSWVLLSDVTGSTVIDIWKDTYANYPPTSGDSITSLAKPSIVSGTKNQSSTLTGWNTIVNSGDIIRFNVDSCTGMTKATLTIIGKEF